MKARGLINTFTGNLAETDADLFRDTWRIMETDKLVDKLHENPTEVLV